MAIVRQQSAGDPAMPQLPKALVFNLLSVLLCGAVAQAEIALPEGWKTAAPRPETRPTFAFNAKAGPKETLGLEIECSNSVADHGWVQKSFPVTGGKFVRFSVLRKTEN